MDGLAVETAEQAMEVTIAATVMAKAVALAEETATLKAAVMVKPKAAAMAMTTVAAMAKRKVVAMAKRRVVAMAMSRAAAAMMRRMVQWWRPQGRQDQGSQRQSAAYGRSGR